MERIALKIDLLTATLIDARPVLYIMAGQDGQYSFVAPTPVIAALAMKELHIMAAFEPVSVEYVGELRTGESAAPTPMLYAHELPSRKDIRNGVIGGLVRVEGGR